MPISTTVTETFNIIKLPCMGVMGNCVLIVNVEKRNVKHPVYVCMYMCVYVSMPPIDKVKITTNRRFYRHQLVNVKTYL